MIPVGQHYRPTGQFELVGTILAAASCMLLAIAVATVVWLWEISPIPRFLILTSMLQGLAVGYGAMILFRKSRLRNPVLAGIIAFVSGATSIFLVHYGLYVYFVYQFRSAVDQDVAGRADANPAVLAELNNHPYAVTDRVVFYPKTGHHGFVGFMYLRNSDGEKIGHAGMDGSTISGTFLWLLWGVEALAVAGFASICGYGAASEPFCEDCVQWFNKPRTILWLPKDKIQPLTAAVSSNDARQLAALLPPPEFDAAKGSAATALHECPGCGQALADVVARTPSGKKGQFRQRKTIKHLAVSKEMVAAMQTKPPVPAKPA